MGRQKDLTMVAQLMPFTNDEELVEKYFKLVLDPVSISEDCLGKILYSISEVSQVS